MTGRKQRSPNTYLSKQHGLFEFKVMSFGLCNAPATFQRLKDLVLAGVQWSHCLVYLGDIIVVEKDFEEHLQNLSIVLQQQRAANLRWKPVKCSFCREEVPYIGHIVSRNGVSTDPEKNYKGIYLAHSNHSARSTKVPWTGIVLLAICQELCYHFQPPSQTYRKGSAV